MYRMFFYIPETEFRAESRHFYGEVLSLDEALSASAAANAVECRAFDRGFAVIGMYTEIY